MRPIAISWLGTVASVMGFAWTVWPRKFEPLQIVVVTIAAVVFLGSLLVDTWEHLRRRPKRFHSPEDIVGYMRRWISSGGRAVIFSRDMSWAQEPDIKTLLLQKAAQNELTICLPNPIPLSRELEQAGATVVIYPGIDYVPASRFTIVNDGRMDGRVAIGRQMNGVHVIEEYSVGEHPVFYIAQDLVEFARRISNEARSHS